MFIYIVAFLIYAMVAAFAGQETFYRTTRGCGCINSSGHCSDGFHITMGVFGGVLWPLVIPVAAGVLLSPSRRERNELRGLQRIHAELDGKVDSLRNQKANLGRHVESLTQDIQRYESIREGQRTATEKAEKSQVPFDQEGSVATADDEVLVSNGIEYRIANGKVVLL